MIVLNAIFLVYCLLVAESYRISCKLGAVGCSDSSFAADPESPGFGRQPLLGEGHVLVGMHSIASRVDDGRRNEDHEISFQTLKRLAPEHAANPRQVTQDGYLVLDLGNRLAEQSTNYDRLPIPNIDTGCDLAKPEAGRGVLAVSGVPTVLPVAD